MTELVEALEYMALESPRSADELFDRVVEAANSLATMSERGRSVPEIEDGLTREIFVGRYRVHYEVSAHHVEIVAFLYGGRDFESWRRERPP